MNGIAGLLFPFFHILIWKQIGALVSSLNFIGIEIKTACSLESWSAGVLVMVSGSVLVKDFSSWRKFVQTFFLAPQEKGFFVLNDIFHFIDEEQIHHHPAVLLAQHNLDHKLSASGPIPEPVPSYFLGGDIQGRELVAHVDVRENGPVDKFSLSEQLHQAPESESIVDNSSVQESNGALLLTVNTVQEHVPPVGEPQKHTYASIKSTSLLADDLISFVHIVWSLKLRVAKGQAVPSVAPEVSLNKNLSPASDGDQTTQQPFISSNVVEMSGADIVDEISPIECEGKASSISVMLNLFAIVSKLIVCGEISPDGVVIRSRKDVGVCYAFVEFEDMASVRPSVMQSRNCTDCRTISVHPRAETKQLYPVSRRKYIFLSPSFNGWRGRGRGSYQTDAPRGRFGARSYGRGGANGRSERDYSRSRGNGFYRPTPRQDQGLSGQQVSKTGQSS
ncbi:hypothetical protein V6N11_054661 [Hibiscus sabdariffa]|uniref:NTF2 domain-containing protein n=1 Tax=Hibiscus sabdariffa TaxID=183260 RepID=A0ABR2S4L2_9ROSI